MDKKHDGGRGVGRDRGEAHGAKFDWSQKAFKGKKIETYNFVNAAKEFGQQAVPRHDGTRTAQFDGHLLLPRLRQQSGKSGTSFFRENVPFDWSRC